MVLEVGAGPARRSLGGGGSVILVSDEPDTSLPGEVGRCPFDQHEQTVAKTDQLENVQEQPGEPCERTGEAQTADIGNGRAAADNRHAAAVCVHETPCRIRYGGD